jgi:diguanylate cyclase (GGDEF)-like protein/PAS domain S-box-containing protein
MTSALIVAMMETTMSLFIFGMIFMLAVSLASYFLGQKIMPKMKSLINTHEKLHESEGRFKSVFDSAAVGMAIARLDGRWTRVNPELCNILGYSEAEFLKSDFQSITYPEDLSSCLEKITQLIKGEIAQFSLEKRFVHKNGNLVWVLSNVSLLRNDKAEPINLIAQIQDVTGRKQAENMLNYQAYHDSLTGLNNRMQLEHDINRLIAVSERNKRGFVIFFMDIDNFKQINDKLGHDAGDRLLVAVAERLKSSTRKYDIVGRYGGDEFVLVLTELNNHEMAAIFAERIMTVMKKPIVIKGQQVFVSISMGVGFYPTDGMDYASLLKNADNALYTAKGNGRNNYQFCAPEISLKIKEKIAFESALQQALDKQEFQLHYLPQIGIMNHRIAGVEALLRWKSQQYGVITPQQIIPSAEETGLIIPLNAWIIETACKQIKSQNEAKQLEMNVAINISARQFTHNNLVESIADGVELTGFNPDRVILEINESLIMQDIELSIDVIKNLKKFGVRVAIDNFGTGFSSLACLQDLAVDYIKIDRTIVQQVTTDAKRASLVSAMIDLAKNLGIRVVAEGVETKDQYHFLKNYGCDEIQGYYISHPLPLEDLTVFLDKHKTKLAELQS